MVTNFSNFIKTRHWWQAIWNDNFDVFYSGTDLSDKLGFKGAKGSLLNFLIFFFLIFFLHFVVFYQALKSIKKLIY